jgi:hypothetical protein
MTLIRRALAHVILVIGLVGCGTSTAEMANTVSVEFLSNSPNPLERAIEIGDVSGGSFADPPLGAHISNASFSKLMTLLLQRNHLLAAPGTGRYRLDCTLDYDTRVAGIASKAITADIRYVLRDARTGEAVFDKAVVTSGTSRYSGAYQLSAAGISGVSGATQAKADENATLENLNQFMPAFGQWIRNGAVKNNPAPPPEEPGSE